VRVAGIVLLVMAIACQLAAPVFAEPVPADKLAGLRSRLPMPRPVAFAAAFVVRATAVVAIASW